MAPTLGAPQSAKYRAPQTRKTTAKGPNRCVNLAPGEKRRLAQSGALRHPAQDGDLHRAEDTAGGPRKPYFLEAQSLSLGAAGPFLFPTCVRRRGRREGRSATKAARFCVGAREKVSEGVPAKELDSDREEFVGDFLAVNHSCLHPPPLRESDGDRSVWL